MDDLLDKLAYYTREHIRLMREKKHSPEYEGCKAELKRISAEISRRKELQPNKTVPGNE